MLPLSVAIITHNEGSRLEQTLSFVASIASDIVIVDSGSTDDTIAIAESFGARVIRKSFTTYNEQRNYALSQCTQPWVLYLNAGDSISVDLRIHLQRIIVASMDAGGIAGVVETGVAGVVRVADAGTDSVADVTISSPIAYKVRVESFILRRKVRHGVLRPKYEYRFFSAGSVGFALDKFDSPPTIIDTSTSVEGGKITDPVLRHLAPTVDSYVDRMNRHSDVVAEYYHGQGMYALRGVQTSWRHFFQGLRYLKYGFMFVVLFLYHYVIQGAFLNSRSLVSLCFSYALVPVIARAKTDRLYSDYASMYDIEAFDVPSDTPSDRVYDEASGRLVLRRILVSRVDKLGDMIVCIPAIKMLRNMYPDAQIDVLASPYNSDIPQNLPYVDAVYTRGALGSELPGKAAVRDADLLKTLNANKYDVIIMTMTSPDLTKFVSNLEVPYKVSGKHLRVYRHGFRIRRTELYRHQHEGEYALLLVRHTNPRRYDEVFQLDRAIHYSDADKSAVADFLSERGLQPCYTRAKSSQFPVVSDFAVGMLQGGSPLGTSGTLGTLGASGVSDTVPEVEPASTSSSSDSPSTLSEILGIASITGIPISAGGAIGAPTAIPSAMVSDSRRDGVPRDESPPEQGYVVINVFHGGSSNNASLLTYRKIVSSLVAGGHQVVIIAVPYEPRIYNARIANIYFGGMDGVHIFSDAANILRTVAIIDAAKLYVGSSTGPTHMANALDVPSVIVFRNNPTEMRTWGSKYTYSRHVLIPNRERAMPYTSHVNYLSSTVVSYCERVLKELY